ncbi:hypothetical protein [Aeromicrobium wangtongii]|uniref:Uncharacterized protein n=1 Tax=Aeromicrobium wangtongii TaxID=2969247 RepID=A0ABY5MBY1_9ACTN|nr:hypothetical protein [Aeromicrobium wangtongii]MCD9196984.1 hypothetical protein [Aeromicrobium wangtongii]UUP14485.1 hypothetical protein NQV15_04010 [Aeromicrobium wangtongii]
MNKVATEPTSEVDQALGGDLLSDALDLSRMIEAKNIFNCPDGNRVFTDLNVPDIADTSEGPRP